MSTLGAGDCSDYFPVQGNKYNYRLKADSWIINWGIYRSFGSEVESQKKKKKGWFRRWWHHRIVRIEIDATFSYVEPVNSEESEVQYDYRFRYTKYNAAEIRHTYMKDRDHSVSKAQIAAYFEGAADELGNTASCSGNRTWNWN